MVRIKRTLAVWASNVAITIQPDQLPDVNVTRIEPSRANVIEQCILWGLARLDPRGLQSEFGLRQARGNRPPLCPLCKQELVDNQGNRPAIHPAAKRS